MHGPGAPAVLDYLETIPASMQNTSASKESHAMARPLWLRWPRSAICDGAGWLISAGGATPLRRNYGEAVESLTGGEYIGWPAI